jgi:hypothetical protein
VGGQVPVQPVAVARQPAVVGVAGINPTVAGRRVGSSARDVGLRRLGEQLAKFDRDWLVSAVKGDGLHRPQPGNPAEVQGACLDALFTRVIVNHGSRFVA